MSMPAIRSRRIVRYGLLTMAVCAGAVWIDAEFLRPFRVHQTALHRLQDANQRLTSLRPPQYSRDEWSFVIGWTQNGIGNCFGFPDAVTNPQAFTTFAIEAQRRVGTEDADQTVEWIWDQMVLLSKYGPEYSARYRPTSSERLKEAKWTRIGPSVD